MIEEFTYKGVWFIPEKPENQITGTLTFKPNSDPNLELLGSFYRGNSMHEPTFILGYSTDGEKITLYKSFEYSRSAVTEYAPMYVMIGEHFYKEEDFKFKIIKGRFKNLEQWIDISGFESVDTDFDTHETKIHYQLPDPIKFEVEQGITGTINFTSSVPYQRKELTVTVKQHCEIHLEFDQAHSFFVVLSKLSLFQNFLTLATFEPVFPTSIKLICIPSLNENNDDFTRIDVIYKPGFNYKKTNTTQFLFKYKDIVNDFDTIISKWFALADKIEPVTNLLFDSFYYGEVFNENKFLNIIHALETFHRRFRVNDVLPQESYKKRIDNIIAEVTKDEDKEWLKEIFNIKNEHSLQTRLENLLDEASSETIEKIIAEKKTFIKNAKNSRNYYTHYDLRKERTALKGSKLYSHTQRLRVLLIIIILKEMSFSKEKIDNLFKRNETKLLRHIFYDVIN